MTNTNKLKGRIVEKGYNLSSFSCAVKMSRPCLRHRLNGISEFKVSEIERICKLLDISCEELSEYFFINNVPKTNT